MINKSEVIEMVKKTLEYYLGRLGARVYVRGDSVYLEHAGYILEYRVIEKNGTIYICPHLAGKKCWYCISPEMEEIYNISTGLAEMCGVPVE